MSDCLSGPGGCRQWSTEEGMKRQELRRLARVVSLPWWKVGLCDGHTVHRGNSPLSMKWLSICSACRAPINAGGTRGRSSEKEDKNNCGSEMSNLPHNVKVVLWTVYTLKLKLYKNESVLQSHVPKHHCFFPVTPSRIVGTLGHRGHSLDHWYQNKMIFYNLSHRT